MKTIIPRHGDTRAMDGCGVRGCRDCHSKEHRRRKAAAVDRLPRCADCDVDTFDNGEYYMVHAEIWAAAWAGRRVNCDCGAFGTVGGFQCVFEFNDTSRRRCEACEVLCIGCLEQRLGRTLTRADFTDCRLNDPDKFTSARLRSRLERSKA